MKKAPLRYVLAIMRFTPVLTMDRYVEQFQERVRKNYPHFSDQKHQGVQLEVGPNGATTRQVNGTTWQFSSADRRFAIMLGKDFLVVHAGTGYNGHEDFLERMRYALAAFQDIDGLPDHFTSLGYRYVDMIVPQKEQSLSDYLNSWVMPVEDVAALDGLSLLNGASFTAFKAELGVVRFSALRRPPVSLPHELLNQFIHENGWYEQPPSEEFALLDFDYSAPMPQTPEIVADTVIQKLSIMSSVLSKLFDQAITDHARTVWR
ncbi:TIGR04255 family protein [Gluconobacter oxydans]|uniref:TIGR04255 family protein n=1 Tax=Gluconobacter oxydans TaxID=442 RepID=UPI0039E86E99